MSPESPRSWAPEVLFRHHGQVGVRKAERPCDECMGKARSWLVRACLDLVPVTTTGELLLGRRGHQPRMGEWWIFGGKWPWGASPEMALTQTAGNELGIAIERDRFYELPYRSLAWPTRREPPQDDGVHDISLPFALVLDPSELTRVLRHLERRHDAEIIEARLWRLGDLERLYPADDPVLAVAQDALEAVFVNP